MYNLFSMLWALSIENSYGIWRCLALNRRAEKRRIQASSGAEQSAPSDGSGWERSSLLSTRTTLDTLARTAPSSPPLYVRGLDRVLIGVGRHKEKLGAKEFSCVCPRFFYVK